MRKSSQSFEETEFEYNLILATDYNTMGHTQWYFFSVANTRKNTEYRFNIINLLKVDSLYNVGMKPLIYSHKISTKKGLGWHRDGNDICYYTTNTKRKNFGNFSCLTFTLKFQRRAFLTQTTTTVFTSPIATHTPTHSYKDIYVPCSKTLQRNQDSVVNSCA